MGKVKQKSDGKGSLKDIQLLVNEHHDLLNAFINGHVATLRNDPIKWVSPLKENYYEYSDDDFIEVLDLKLKKELKDFWPKKGPQWDALGKSNSGVVFLVEAKANIPEIVSPATAASPDSKKKIVRALDCTKKHLGITNDVDWSGKFYQYTNRLAHLYFLREQNNIPTYLVNIYFMNDKEVNGPQSKREWQAAIDVMKSYLGVGHHILSKYIIDVFIDVDDFRKLK
jgi:hypothetical protein